MFEVKVVDFIEVCILLYAILILNYYSRYCQCRIRQSWGPDTCV